MSENSVLSFFMDRAKDQDESILTPAEAPPDAIISADTTRANRIPPGQSRTRKWPVLDAWGPPQIDLAAWRFRVWGLVAQPFELTWDEFNALPRVRVFSDFHCVTRWSRLGNVWEGISIQEIAQRAGIRPEAAFVLAHGCDRGFTTNLPVSDLLQPDCLIATHHDGDPISTDHGGPARLIVPRLYAWKSAKWLSGLEFLPQDQAGFWEVNGYHMRGDPWQEERHSW